MDGLSAIVTGGATGIGIGIVERLLADGASVLVGAFGEEELKRATSKLRESGHEPAGFVGDLSKVGAADRLLAAAVDAFGRVDILVNNAGGGVIRPTLEHTEETLRATIDNNLWTTIRCILALLPHMVERGHGADPHVSPGLGGGRRGCGRLPGRPGRWIRHRPGHQRQWRQQHGLSRDRHAAQPVSTGLPLDRR